MNERALRAQYYDGIKYESISHCQREVFTHAAQPHMHHHHHHYTRVLYTHDTLCLIIIFLMPKVPVPCYVCCTVKICLHDTNQTYNADTLCKNNGEHANIQKKNVKTWKRKIDQKSQARDRTWHNLRRLLRFIWLWHLSDNDLFDVWITLQYIVEAEGRRIKVGLHYLRLRGCTAFVWRDETKTHRGSTL